MTKTNLSLNDIMIGSIPDHVAYGDEIGRAHV